MILRSKESFILYVRNFIFGVEDSLVSTVGLLSGVAVAGIEKREILISGIILIFVEAFSMGIGSTLSEHSAEKYQKHMEVPIKRSFLGGIIMFFSYFISGFIPLAPYIFLSASQAFLLSIMLSLMFLFLLGIVGAKIFGINTFKNGLEMLMLGGVAILVGVFVGKIVNLV